ncbi:DUF72 domain-containing protein [Chloroflexota bacterium]
MSAKVKLCIGTSGWSYPTGQGTWKEYFYPAGVKNELEYYGQFFNTVEINSSFYRPPNPDYVSRWVQRVPEDFIFTVKLWQKFTHPGMYQAATGEAAAVSRDDIDLFQSSIEVLHRFGKLGALLAQFPPGFRNDAYGQQLLKAVITNFGGYRLAVELRHRSWSDDKSTAELLREFNVAWVQIDEPKFPSSIAGDIPVTANMAYFRFHGRNRENWWRGDGETRYRYLYSQEEIDELAGKVKAAAEQSDLTLAFFNNHWQGYAPRNAVDMKKALRLPFREIHVPRRLLDEDMQK